MPVTDSNSFNNSRMKVLLISPLPPPAGGIGTVARSLVNYVAGYPCGIELTVCNTTHRLRPETSMNLIVRLITGITNSLAAIYRTWRIILHGRPDVIHLASSASLAMVKDLAILWIARRSYVPVVMHWHFGRIPSLMQHRNREWKLLCRTIRYSAHSVVIDAVSCQSLQAAGFSNVSYIPNPMAEDIESMARNLLVPEEKRVSRTVLFVGHIIRSKGVYELVEACSRIADVKELILAGPYETSLRGDLERIASHRMDGRWLHFTGAISRTEVLDLMRMAPVFVLPSYTEGFPMVILEAMAMGCAVVATAVGAVPEMLEAGTADPCGVCIPEYRTDILGDAIRQLLNDPQALERFGRKAKASVLQRYTMSKIFPRYMQVWQDALQVQAGPAIQGTIINHIPAAS